TDTFTYTVTDGEGSTDTATVTMTVTGANHAPTTGGIANITAQADDPDELINLFAAFDDVEDADAAMGYSVVTNTDPSLFVSVVIDPGAGTLTLDYDPAASGLTTITVRAMDTGGLWVDATFTVRLGAAVLPDIAVPPVELPPPVEPPADPPEEPTAEEEPVEEDPVEEEPVETETEPTTDPPAPDPVVDLLAAAPPVRSSLPPPAADPPVFFAAAPPPAMDVDVAVSPMEVARALEIPDTRTPQATPTNPYGFGAPATPTNLAFVSQSGLFWNELDDMKQEMGADIRLKDLVVDGAMTVSISLTAGYVLWTIRGGYLLASLLTQMPAWRIVDPLPILDYLDEEDTLDPSDDDGDDDSLESMIDRADRRSKGTAA
ncbi:MAG: cadherin-like domain-containing protein, partial [Phycisphaerae bacterium]|nr:cadherin-like domain-containing protein [Phycisphaerae bacterium]